MGVLNVMAPPFRAKGDGVTDDTAALQAALDALENGDTLHMPGEGVFRTTSKLTLSNVSAILDCKGQIMVDPGEAPDIDTALEIVGAETGTKPRVIIEYLDIDGTNDVDDLLHLVHDFDTGSQFGGIIMLHRGKEKALRIDGEVISTRWGNIEISGPGHEHGIYCDDVMRLSGTRFGKLRIVETQQSALFLRNPAESSIDCMVFDDPVIESNNGVAFDMLGGMHVMLMKGHFEGNTQTLGDADILMGHYPSMSAPCCMSLYGTTFSTPGPHQGYRRVKFVDTVCKFNVFGGIWTNSNYEIDVNGKTASSRIYCFGLNPRPKVINCNQNQYKFWDELPAFIETDVQHHTESAAVEFEDGGSNYVDASSGAVTITLPSQSYYKGAIARVTKTDSSVNIVTVTPCAEGSITLCSQYDSVTLEYDGSAWYRVATV